MHYVGDKWLALFALEKASDEPIPPSSLKHGDSTVINYRVKTILSGNQIEVEAVPIWSTAPSMIPVKKSPEAIRRANAENTRKHFERKMNANFCDEDFQVKQRGYWRTAAIRVRAAERISLQYGCASHLTYTARHGYAHCRGSSRATLGCEQRRDAM